MDPKLSVVVPFCNVEEYIEIILGDDGLREGSLATAEERVAKGERFRLVRQENQGLGPARSISKRWPGPGRSSVTVGSRTGTSSARTSSTSRPVTGIR